MAGGENRPLTTTEPLYSGGPTLADIYRAATPGSTSSTPVPSIEEIWSTRPDVVSVYNTWLLQQPGQTQIGPPGTPPPSVLPPGEVPTFPTPAPSAPPAPAGDLDLSALLAAMEEPVSTGYTPSLVDTSAAEQMFILGPTAAEQAALDEALADLEARATAGTQAVRQGWEQVRAINARAAAKAAEMARNSGPEAAQLWLDAANNALTLAAQAGEALATTPGMQAVNVSPTAGAENISALLAAQAPRAQALAERMGLASAEEIAAQARTASMMGEAYAGDIQRTLLIEANRTRQAHNERVLNRVAAERQAVGQMRFQAAQTNAQLLSQAAAQAASGSTTGEGRRNAVRNLISDVREFANIDPLESEPRNGIAALMGIYGFDAETARGLILGAREGTLDWGAAMAEIGG